MSVDYVELIVVEKQLVISPLSRFIDRRWPGTKLYVTNCSTFATCRRSREAMPRKRPTTIWLSTR
jgi:hypothetical protein